MEDSRITETAKAALAAPAIKGDVDTFVARLRAEMHAEPVPVSVATKSGVGTDQLKSWGRWTVGLGALTTAIVVMIIALKYIPNIHFRQSTPQTKTYTTAPAQRANIILADGSRVILAPATKLIVTGRNVELKGEAVFTVNQRNSSPFTVKAGDAIVRVLGTTFSIQAYDKTVRIAVSDGKVSVSSYTLTAGNVAVVTDTSSQIFYNANVAELTAWTHGQLIFRNALVSNVLTQLSRWYDLQLDVADSELSDRHINTMIKGNTLTDDELRNLAEAIGARIERSGRKIVFHSVNR